MSVALCPPCYAFHYVPLMHGPTVQTYEREHSPDVLVVDDDPALLQALSLALEAEGYRVDTASSGEDALMKVWNRWPGVIVLDVRLPAMSGPGLLKVLRQMLPERPLPVVMMSGYDRVSEHDRQGANAFLRKPFPMGDLVDVVRELTGSPIA